MQLKTVILNEAILSISQSALDSANPSNNNEASSDNNLDMNVGVYIVMVCPWTDHILARNLLLKVEADLP